MVKMGWSKRRGEAKLALVWLVKTGSHAAASSMEMQVVWRSDVVRDSGEQSLEGSLGGVCRVPPRAEDGPLWDMGMGFLMAAWKLKTLDLCSLDRLQFSNTCCLSYILLLLLVTLAIIVFGLSDAAAWINKLHLHRRVLHTVKMTDEHSSKKAKPSSRKHHGTMTKIPSISEGKSNSNQLVISITQCRMTIH